MKMLWPKNVLYDAMVIEKTKKNEKMIKKINQFGYPPLVPHLHCELPTVFRYWKAEN